jgi:hypothetical protein
MLSSTDFHPDQWSLVTYQLFSANYVHGFALSTIIPPVDYLNWLITQYGLDEPSSIKIQSEGVTEGKMTWKIIIQKAYEYSLAQKDPF